MAIYWICPSCNTPNSLNKKKCKCGTSYPKSGNRKFRVQVQINKRRLSRSAQTLAMAREIEIVLKEKLLKEKYFGKENKTSKITLNKFFQDHYFPWAKTNLKYSKTIESYYNNWIKDRLGEKNIDEITVQNIEQLKVNILSSGRSARTAQQIIAILKALFNKAIEWDFLKKNNPAKNIKIPKFDNKRTRFLSEKEACKLLKECKKRTTSKNYLYQMVLLALSTGMRAREIFNLKWQDVDFKNKVIWIRDAKSGDSRVTFLSDKVEKELLSLCSKKERNGYIFKKGNNEPFHEVPKIFYRIVNQLGFNKNIEDRREKVVFHTLRHTFCSWLAIEGVPLHVIKELAGHKTLQMTERYAHLMPDIKRKAIEEIWEKIGLFSD